VLLLSPDGPPAGWLLLLVQSPHGQSTASARAVAPDATVADLANELAQAESLGQVVQFAALGK
jgi:hypothetical protein